MGCSTDDLTLPDFLNRALNPRVYTDEEQRIIKYTHAKTQKLAWPKKRNWRKIEQRRREQEKREGAALIAGTIVRRRGQ